MFVFAHIWLPRLTFSLDYENWELIWKKHADSKYESRFALRLSVNYEPLKHLQSPHLDLSFGARKDWFELNSFINTILLNSILKVWFYFLDISLYKRGQFWLLCSQIFAVVVTVRQLVRRHFSQQLLHCLHQWSKQFRFWWLKFTTAA